MAHGISWRILVDNDAHEPGLESEHGLALWIEAGAQRVLFDCGATDMIVRNAARLGVPLETTTALVLSHGHFDHTGGLAAVDGILPPGTLIFAHAGVMCERFSRRADGTVHAIGMPAASRAVLERRRAHVRWVTGPQAVAARIWVTGPIPRRTDFEDTGGSFWLDAACTRPDPIEDDMALWTVEEERLDVFFGCAHAGVVNAIQAIHGTTGKRPIRDLVGGLHLRDALDVRLLSTRGFLRSVGVENMCACHCTGGQLAL